MDTYAAALMLFLIMDPLGNIPVVLSILKKVDPARRIKVLLRELVIALILMLIFLYSGSALLKLLSLSKEAVSISGGLVLLIIAIRMIFPSRGGVMGDDEDDSEPLVVPLATPMIAGPSILATRSISRERAEPQRRLVDCPTYQLGCDCDYFNCRTITLSNTRQTRLESDRASNGYDFDFDCCSDADQRIFSDSIAFQIALQLIIHDASYLTRLLIRQGVIRTCHEMVVPVAHTF